VLVTGQVGNGAFAVFGDDAIFQNKFLYGTNRKLAANCFCGTVICDAD